MGMIDKEALLSRRELTTEDVELPAGTVQVRGLTRAEALRVTGRKLEESEAERVLLAMALVDPVLTEDEVRTWQRNAPAGELQPVVVAIQRLSGLAADAVKESMATFRE